MVDLTGGDIAMADVPLHEWAADRFREMEHTREAQIARVNDNVEALRREFAQFAQENRAHIDKLRADLEGLGRRVDREIRDPLFEAVGDARNRDARLDELEETVDRHAGVIDSIQSRAAYVAAFCTIAGGGIATGIIELVRHL